jgi:hypothetical protein
LQQGWVLAVGEREARRGEQHLSHGTAGSGPG